MKEFKYTILYCFCENFCDSGSGSASQKVTVPTVPVPVPQRCLWVCYIFGIYWKWAGPGASSGSPPPASGGPKRGDEAADCGGGDAAEAEYHLGSSAG